MTDLLSKGAPGPVLPTLASAGTNAVPRVGLPISESLRGIGSLEWADVSMLGLDFDEFLGFRLLEKLGLDLFISLTEVPRRTCRSDCDLYIGPIRGSRS